MTKAVLLRVGIDSGAGGIQGPLFADDSFEFVCIPDKKGVSIHRYGEWKGKNGRPHSDYFSARRRATICETTIHVDPEFETFTYGDPTIPKRSLRKLNQGDYLIFYCGLQRWDEEGGWCKKNPPGLYLVGYFVVEAAGMAADFGTAELKSQFGENFHVRYPTVLAQQKKDLVLVKGGTGSRLLRRAYRISSVGEDKTGKPLKVLSPEMQEVFGVLTGRGSIQRSNPRWIDHRFVASAIQHVNALE